MTISAISARGGMSLRITSPPFITNFTRCISVISFSGSPDTAIRSANLPSSMLPTLSSMRMIFAFTVMAMRSAFGGVTPHFT